MQSDKFEKSLGSLFVRANSGLNDNLNGIERPVAFETKEGGMQAEIVHSLAKWKRLALHKYGFPQEKAFIPI